METLRLKPHQVHLTTLQLPTHHHLAGGINAMHLEDRLSEVETDRRNRLHDLAPPNRGSSAGTHIHGTHVPVEEPSTASIADMETVSVAKVLALTFEWRFAAKSKIAIRCTLRQRLSAFQMNSS
jgi:hypothetical protein